MALGVRNRHCCRGKCSQIDLSMLGWRSVREKEVVLVRSDYHNDMARLLGTVLTKRSFGIKADQLLSDFIVDVRSRLEACKFSDEVAQRYWESIRGLAIEAVASVESLKGRLSVHSPDEFARFSDALQRVRRGLELAERNEIEYADWLVFANETLVRLLNDRKLVGIPVEGKRRSGWTDSWNQDESDEGSSDHPAPFLDIGLMYSAPIVRASATAEALNL